jgi:alpha-mannosidase
VTPVAELWEDAFLPPHAVWLRQSTELSIPEIDARLEGEGLIFSSLKPAGHGDGIVLRCYNTAGSAVASALELGVPFAAARVRADEREPEPLEARDGAVRFTAGPREIVTLLLTSP